MADNSVKIPVEIIPPKDSLKPIIQDVKELTKQIENQQKVLTGSSGLASTLNSTTSSPKAIFSQKESDRIADQKHAEAEKLKEIEDKEAVDAIVAAERLAAKEEAIEKKKIADLLKAEEDFAAKKRALDNQAVTEAANRAKQIAKGRELSAKSDARAGASLLAKELAANVAPVSEESGGGSNLRSALRQGAQVAGLQRVGRALASLAGPLGIVVAGFAAVAAGIKLAVAGFKAFLDQQSKIRELNEALAVSGNFSAKLSKSIQDLAKARQLNTGIGEDKWLEAYEKLLRGGAAASDLAGFSDKIAQLKVITGSFEEAVKLLTEAQEGNFDGFKKLGIFIPEHASQIEKLEALYRQTARAADILADSQDKLSKHVNSVEMEMHDSLVTIGKFSTMIATPFVSLWSAQIHGAQYAFSLLGKVLRLTHEEQSKLKSATTGFTPIIYDQVKATRELHENLEVERKELELIEGVTNRMVAADKRHADAKKSAIELEKDAKLAMVDSAETRGKISHVSASLYRLQITRESEIRQIKIDQAQKDKEIADKQKEYAFEKNKIGQAIYNSDRSHYLFDEAKKGGTNPQTLAEIEGAVKEGDERAKIARDQLPHLNQLADELRQLKEAKSRSFRESGGKIAVEDIRARDEIYQKHEEEVQAFKKDPRSKLTPLTNDQMGVLNKLKEQQSADKQYNGELIRALQLITDFKKDSSSIIRELANKLANGARNG